MKKLFILLSISLFMLAACCNSPKNAESTKTKSEAGCGGCQETKAESSCSAEHKGCSDTKKECCGDCEEPTTPKKACSTDDCNDCPSAKKDCPEAKK